MDMSGYRLRLSSSTRPRVLHTWERGEWRRPAAGALGRGRGGGLQKRTYAGRRRSGGGATDAGARWSAVGVDRGHRWEGGAGGEGKSQGVRGGAGIRRRALAGGGGRDGRQWYPRRRRRSLARARVKSRRAGLGTRGGTKGRDGRDGRSECIAMFRSWPLYSGAGSIGQLWEPQYLDRIHHMNTQAIQTI
jgi:hypothetical protein